jgi:hypothetical protein
MSKQTRRSISLKGSTVSRIREHALLKTSKGSSCSAIIENLIRASLDKLGAPAASQVQR